MALAHAFLGSAEESRRLIGNLLAMPRNSRDVLARAGLITLSAEIHTILGDFEAAVATLEERLNLDSALTVREIAIGPRWDALRDRADFQALMQRHPT